MIQGLIGDPYGGADDAEVTIDVPPSANSEYLVAFAIFLYHLRGAATGNEGFPFALINVDIGQI